MRLRLAPVYDVPIALFAWLPHECEDCRETRWLERMWRVRTESYGFDFFRWRCESCARPQRAIRATQ